MSREGIVEICGTPTAELVALDQWTETLAEVRRRIAHRFRRVEVREHVGRYLTGLLGQVERKNGWQLVEAMGEADPHGVQRLLNGAVWDADAVRDDLRAYVLMLPETTAIQYCGRRERAEQLGARLGEAAGRISATGTNGQAAGAHRWVCLTLTDPAPDGMRRWLLIRRRTEAPGDLAYHLAFGPEGTTVEELVRVCSVRWQIEEGFAQAKGEIGLDHYEVRGWVAWHRWVTLCLLAHAYLVVLRQRARAPDADVREDAAEPDLLPLTVPEARRLVLALAEPIERRAFRLGWSRWHRAHQARAARCHAARAAPVPRAPDSTRVALLPAMPGAALTDAEWAGVLPLLLPQRPTTGRPRHNHRTVLSGIVWVFRTDASWRGMLKECGKWETAYKRYQLWRAEGRWQRIAAALGIAEREVAL